MDTRIDWKAIARARDLKIPPAELDLIAPRLDTLEEAFRPLARKLTPNQEPAASFHADPESE